MKKYLNNLYCTNVVYVGPRMAEFYILNSLHGADLTAELESDFTPSLGAECLIYPELLQLQP